MPVDIKTKLQNTIHQVLADNNFDVDINEINISQSKDNKNGDYASNVALKFAARFKLKPFELGQIIVKNIRKNFIDHIEIAGPGFLNFFLKHNALEDELKKVIALEDSYGRGEKKNIKINVEFVSANPTGDLHLGHARIASLGDSICRLFSFAGYDVTREYYVNDAGNQVDNLALSLRARYHQAFGENYPIPEDGYHGEDIINIANKIKDEFADKYLEDNDDNLLFFKNYGIQAELDKINRDLKDFRVSFDVYTSERDIRKNHHVEDVLKNKYKKYTYEQNGAIFLKTTDFLDDKDRAVVKSDGSFTYLMPDIAYHLNKLERGYDLLIDILGADHHGYINRLKSAMMMQGYPKDCLEVELVQMVRLLSHGEEVKMSKRTGNAISLRELCEEVGVDAVRYFFVQRDAFSHLDFNIDLASEHSEANPVFYAQYAHARLCRMLENASDIIPELNCDLLIDNSENELIKTLVSFPQFVEQCAKQRKPNKMTNYINNLATLIHEFYTKCRVIDRNNIPLTKARLALVKAAKIVMKNALNLIGVSAPNNM